MLRPVVLLSILALAACSGGGETHRDSADTDPPAPTATWSEAFDTSAAGALSGVWGAAPDDVYIVGGSDAGGEIYHFDGASWSPMAVPEGSGLLVWCYGFGPDDIYAVGVDGTAIHWDGTAWSALDTGTDEDLWGVFGFASDDLWVVGGVPDVGEPVVLHWDGATFERMTLDPSENSRNATALFKVWGVDGTLFAVGQRGLVVTWDGERWVEVSAGAQADQDFVSLWGTSADHIVAVGGRSNARVATWDGTSWTTTAPSGLGGLSAVYMTEPDQTVIGGIYGFVGTFDYDSATVDQETSPTDEDIHAIWGDGEGTFYAVGGRFLSPYRGVALVRTVEEGR